MELLESKEHHVMLKRKVTSVVFSEADTTSLSELFAFAII